MKQEFIATPDMIEAGNDLLVRIVMEQTIREIVEKWQRRILEMMQSGLAKRWLEHGMKDEIILDPKNAYLLDEEHYDLYDKGCKTAWETIGLLVDDPEFCPLCVAENERLRAERALVKAFEPITGITWDQLCNAGLDKLKEYIDLSLRLVSPKVDKEEAKRRLDVLARAKFRDPVKLGLVEKKGA